MTQIRVDLEKQVKMLETLVEERTSDVTSLQAEKMQLREELASCQELNKLHEHLQVFYVHFSKHIYKASRSIYYPPSLKLR